MGVVLATQNPVDLDYKGLSNIGTWWLGRLQTERDKARVLDGLEGASDAGGLDRAEVDRLLSALTSRVFLMRNVHEDGLTLFHSRWALSYLRGLLGREDIRTLTRFQRSSVPGVGPQATQAVAPTSTLSSSAPAALTGRPIMPADIPQFFSPEAAAALTTPLRPILYGAATVRYVDRS